MCDIATLDSLPNLILSKLTITGRNLIVGIAAHQGSGESALALDLTRTLYTSKIRAAVVCLDDYFIPIHERNALARLDHPFFSKQRVPGTRDIESLRNLLKEVSKGIFPGPSSARQGMKGINLKTSTRPPITVKEKSSYPEVGVWDAVHAKISRYR